MMRVLVLGGTRFIGAAIVRRLFARGHDVAVFHRGETEAPLPSEVFHIHGDVSSIDDHRAAFASFAPDIVVDTQVLNEAMARRAVEATRDIARRYVLVSSQDVYRAYGRFHGTEPGEPEAVPLSEDAPLREGRYPYRGKNMGFDDYDKIPAEQYVLAQGYVEPTILRLPAVYGPEDYQHRLFNELKRMDDGRPFIAIEEAFANWRWSRAYVENVGEAVALAATDDRAVGRVYNVGDGDALSTAEWIRLVGRLAGWKGEVRILPKGSLPSSADTEQHVVADTTRIRRELGYADIVAREDGLLRTIAWERAHRPPYDETMFDYAAEDRLVARILETGP